MGTVYEEQMNAFVELTRILANMKEKGIKKVKVGEIVIPITEKYAVSIKAIERRIEYMSKTYETFKVRNGWITFNEE